MTHFLEDQVVRTTGWQAFERAIARLLRARGYENVALVGQTGDGGADVLGTFKGRRWLLQAKRHTNPVGPEVLTRTVEAARTYEADVPVVVSLEGFTMSAIQQRDYLARQGINVQLWGPTELAQQRTLIPSEPLALRTPSAYTLREYQLQAADKIMAAWTREAPSPLNSGLVVLATGLGKTFVAGEVLRRMSATKPDLRVLVLAHTIDLVYQFDRSIWPFLRADQATAIVSGTERPDWTDLYRFSVVVATRDTVYNAVSKEVELPNFDVVIVDEAHHLGSGTYDEALEGLRVGAPNGPFLIGLTATPWRPGGASLDRWFDGPTVSLDLVAGLKAGYLANVDYRMYTDNVDWHALIKLRGDKFSPRAINRTLFIKEWDDAVIQRTAEAWQEISKPRGIVFCGTVDHADRTAALINSLGFTSARPIYSRGSTGRVLSPVERSKTIWDFADGKIGILCAVDVLNEGVDVPDVNLVVFQRVTHSRRIFVQQLGRGLRLSPGKDKVLVLDFVSDIRRFAAGLELDSSLQNAGPRPGAPQRIGYGSSISFRRANDSDLSGRAFLKEWLGDVQEVEDAGEDVSVLNFPPLANLPGAKR